MQVYYLCASAGTPAFYKHEPLPNINVIGAQPSLEVGEKMGVVSLMEHVKWIEKIQERCPHKLDNGESAVVSSSAGLESDCSICGKDWDYD